MLRYNQNLQKSTYLVYGSRRPHQVLSENGKLRLQFTQAHLNLTTEVWKTLPGLMSLNFCCNIWMVG